MDQPPTGKNLKIFLATILGILCFCSLLILFLVAETGLVRIPVMTSWFYSGPQPARVIQAEPLELEVFKARLANEARRQVAATGSQSVTWRVSEQDLTAVLKSTISTGLKMPNVLVEYVQLAIQSDGLEFFGKLREKNVRAEVLVTFVPVLDDKGVFFKMTSVELGDYSIPPHVASQIASLFFASDLGTWRVDWGEIGAKNIRLDEGFLEIVVIPAMR